MCHSQEPAAAHHDDGGGPCSLGNHGSHSCGKERLRTKRLDRPTREAAARCKQLADVDDCSAEQTAPAEVDNLAAVEAEAVHHTPAAQVQFAQALVLRGADRPLESAQRYAQELGTSTTAASTARPTATLSATAES
jgi:hypothetical protein